MIRGWLRLRPRKGRLFLNKESLEPIEAAKGELIFGFGSITVKVYKSDVTADELY
ncbi:GH25228 [Drosophila grimshawi]|uniref:GH25228 n=1 Tax=Drosophila grimshawi TaxID=7222 RepID=B4K056_DROGR|nr:GH25228 [Drosophila grimshawi]